MKNNNKIGETINVRGQKIKWNNIFSKIFLLDNQFLNPAESSKIAAINIGPDNIIKTGDIIIIHIIYVINLHLSTQSTGQIENRWVSIFFIHI